MHKIYVTINQPKVNLILNFTESGSINVDR